MVNTKKEPLHMHYWSKEKESQYKQELQSGSHSRALSQSHYKNGMEEEDEEEKKSQKMCLCDKAITSPKENGTPYPS